MLTFRLSFSMHFITANFFRFVFFNKKISPTPPSPIFRSISQSGPIVCNIMRISFSASLEIPEKESLDEEENTVPIGNLSRLEANFFCQDQTEFRHI